MTDFVGIIGFLVGAAIAALGVMILVARGAR